MKVSLCQHNQQVSKRGLCRSSATHGREVVEDVTLRFIGEDEVSRDRERTARYEGHRRGDVGHLREPIQRRCSQASIYQQRIMVADERKANDADRLEDTRAHDGIALRRVALQFRSHMRALDEHRGDDDDHADEGEARGPRELVDVAVEGERVRDADGAERDDELAFGEPR